MVFVGIGLLHELFHEFSLLPIVRLHPPLHGFFHDLNDSASASGLTRNEIRIFEVIHTDRLIAAGDECVLTSFLQLLGELAVLLLDEVLHHFDALNDDFFEYSLSLVQLNHLQTLTLAQLVKQLLVSKLVIGCGCHLRVAMVWVERFESASLQ